MIWQWLLLGLVGALVALTGLLGVALHRARTRARAEAARALTETERLRLRVAQIEQRLRSEPASPETTEFVITEVGATPQPDTGAGDVSTAFAPSRIEGRLFADLVLRDTVVKVAGLAHGVRRACSPENRFRMRYAFAREVKHARRARRAELRQMRRQLQSLRRAGSEDAA